MVSQYAKFLATFLRHPIKTGAVAPSSRWLAERNTADMSVKRADTVVELGPGTGVFTRAIQEHISPQTVFLATEINPDFASTLKQQFHLVNIVNGSAERLHEYLAQFGKSSADCVLCGLR